MAYGLRVKNSNGEIQIDGAYRNLCMAQSGSSVAVANDNTAGGYYTSIGIANSPSVPLIVMQPDTDRYCYIFGYNKSGSDFVSFNAVTEFVQSTLINYKVLRASVSAGAPYGLKVFDPSSNLVFDSNQSYLKILSVSTGITLGDPSYGTYPSTTINHGNISDPFYILSPSGYWTIFRSFTTFTYRVDLRIGIKKLSSTSVSVGWFIHRFFTYPGNLGNLSEGYNPSMKLILCDL